MPRRPEGRRTGALAALTLVVTALVLAGTVEGAGDSLARTAARAWHGVFGDRPEPAPEQAQRVLVLISAPSLADRMAAAEEEPTAKQQRQWNAEAEGAQQLLLAGLRERVVHRPGHGVARVGAIERQEGNATLRRELHLGNGHE